MVDQETGTPRGRREEFLRASREARPSLLAEFWDFLKHNKKWWLIPILVTIVLVGILVAVASNPAAAPFIYPLF